MVLHFFTATRNGTSVGETNNNDVDDIASWSLTEIWKKLRIRRCFWVVVNNIKITVHWLSNHIKIYWLFQDRERKKCSKSAIHLHPTSNSHQDRWKWSNPMKMTTKAMKRQQDLAGARRGRQRTNKRRGQQNQRNNRNGEARGQREGSNNSQQSKRKQNNSNDKHDNCARCQPNRRISSREACITLQVWTASTYAILCPKTATANEWLLRFVATAV